MNERASRAREYLNTYRSNMRLAVRAERDYINASSRAYAITSAIGGDVGGRSHSQEKMADAAAEMVDCADALLSITQARHIAEYQNRNDVIVEVGARNRLLGEVLECVYAEGMTIPEVAKWLADDRRHPYSRTSVYRLHEKALEAACDVMDERGLMGRSAG